jgi:hypothetical protein
MYELKNREGVHVHYVMAREMVNIMLAACDGREGNLEISGIIGYEKEHKRSVLRHLPKHGIAPTVLIVDTKYCEKQGASLQVAPGIPVEWTRILRTPLMTSDYKVSWEPRISGGSGGRSCCAHFRHHVRLTKRQRTIAVVNSRVKRL